MAAAAAAVSCAVAAAHLLLVCVKHATAPDVRQQQGVRLLLPLTYSFLHDGAVNDETSTASSVSSVTAAPANGQLVHPAAAAVVAAVYAIRTAR
jgi:hypothetical protein